MCDTSLWLLLDGYIIKYNLSIIFYYLEISVIYFLYIIIVDGLKLQAEHLSNDYDALLSFVYNELGKVSIYKLFVIELVICEMNGYTLQFNFRMVTVHTKYYLIWNSIVTF